MNRRRTAESASSALQSALPRTEGKGSLIISKACSEDSSTLLEEDSETWCISAEGDIYTWRVSYNQLQFTNLSMILTAEWCTI